MPSLPERFTTGELAQFYHIPHWKILQLFKRKILPEPTRIGSYRVIEAGDLPKVEAALREAGYLPANDDGGPTGEGGNRE